MSKNSAAQKVFMVKPAMTIVEPKKEGVNAPVINLKAAAEEVKPEAEATEAKTDPQMVTISEVIEKVNAEFNAAPEQPKAPEAPKAEKVVLSIEDIKRKNEVLSRLTAKWDALSEKRRRVENFAISHDSDTANVIVKDANGEVFDSNSPKTIGKLIEFWKEEFSAALAIIEKEMREIA